MIAKNFISFNMATNLGNEIKYIAKALSMDKLSGDGHYMKLVHRWFENYIPNSRALMTPSCTQALEMTALLLNIQPGDEVIIPSYTFVSTANAFVLRGAKIVFVDINPDTLCINEDDLVRVISQKTKAIVVVHYAGACCNMDRVMALSKEHNLPVIEDAAQAINSYYKDKPLGSFGDFATFSFHETKNVTSGGEGGLLIINNSSFIERSEIIREKGTNRSAFFNGMTDKYTWIDIGSSYLPSEIQAAALYPQLLELNKVTSRRHEIWSRYRSSFQILALKHNISLPIIGDAVRHNAHIFYLICTDESQRNRFIAYMKCASIQTVFHYLPLHLSNFGLLHSSSCCELQHTVDISSSLVRLPLYYNLSDNDVERVVQCTLSFFDQE